MKKLNYFSNIDNNYIINNFNYDDFINKNKHLNELGIIGILNFYIKNTKSINENIKIEFNNSKDSIAEKVIFDLNKDIYSDLIFDIKIYIHLFDNLLDNELTQKFIDIIKYNKKINLPTDFNIDIYKNINSDLSHLTNDELINHFKQNCIKECRLYKIPDDFCPNIYKNLYNDISSYTNDEALSHFINYGFKEGRLYKIPDNFNIELYKKMYFGNDNIDTQTVMHIFINSKNRNYNKLNII